MNKIISCTDHGSHAWDGKTLQCVSCGRFYNIDQLRDFPVGEECICGENLLPIPWATWRFFSVRPGCHFCAEVEEDKKSIQKKQIEQEV